VKFRDSYVRDHEARVGIVNAWQGMVGRKGRAPTFDLAVYNPWKMVEDGLRAAEKGVDRVRTRVLFQMMRPITHQDTAAPGGAYYNESNDNLLLTRTDTNGT
jgi:hypothetical protein